jgi:predicted amidohydrolase YtcJ
MSTAGAGAVDPRARPGAADRIFVNGLIWPGPRRPQGPEPTALAVRDGRVLACGSDSEIRELAVTGTVVTDLGGRRVVPGLIDGHMHAVRGGATWSSELRWTDVPDLRTALEAVGAAAKRATDGEWIRVVGGWHPCQFPENRVPTRAELDAIAPDHPVYVQALYEVAVSIRSRCARRAWTRPAPTRPAAASNATRRPAS